jgi:hypothetical protein
LTQTAENIETIEMVEIVEIANIHAVFMQVAENMIGCGKRLGEYPTLSAIFLEYFWPQHRRGKQSTWLSQFSFCRPNFRSGSSPRQVAGRKASG